MFLFVLSVVIGNELILTGKRVGLFFQFTIFFFLVSLIFADPIRALACVEDGGATAGFLPAGGEGRNAGGSEG